MRRSRGKDFVRVNGALCATIEEDLEVEAGGMSLSMYVYSLFVIFLL